MAELQKTTKIKFTAALQLPQYQKLINTTLSDKKVAQKFVADITAVVSQNPSLQTCEASTILSAGLMAQSLNLPLAPALGKAYIVPYSGKATLQIGWKGYLALALNTNQYKRIDCRVVHEGEWKGRDEFGEDIIEWNYECENKPIIGYFAYFVLLNGFTKQIYWTKAHCEEHAKKYSAEYRKSGKGKWSEMFDEMALKTVVKQLLSKWGILSTELITSIQADQSVVNDDGTFDYVDNKEEEQKTEVDIPEIDFFEENTEELQD